MIYSVHNPITGAFDYYEGGPSTPINDDLPTPQLRGNSIGMAASAAGRPLPPGARKTGSGPLPVGSVSSGKPGQWKGTSKGSTPSGIGGLGEGGPTLELTMNLRNVAIGAAVALAVVGVGYAIARMNPPAEYDYASVRGRRPW